MDGSVDALVPARLVRHPPPSASGLMVLSLARLRSSHVRVASPGPRPGRPHLVARLHPAAPFPAAPPRAGPDSSRTSSGSAVAARRRAGAPAGSGLSRAGVGAAARTPWRRGLWDRDGRGDRDHLPGRRYRATGPGRRRRRRGPGAESAGRGLIPRWLRGPKTGLGVRGEGVRCGQQEETPPTPILGGSGGQFSTTRFCARSPWGHRGLRPATVRRCGLCRFSCNLWIIRCC